MGENNKKFWRLGLVGYPLGHSLSPRLHTAALAALGLQGEYELYPIPPDDLHQLQALLGRIRDGSLHGLNLTIPHKRSVLHFLDELSPTAAGIGAANTIYLHNEHLVGDNTDAPGFIADLALQTGWEMANLEMAPSTPRVVLVLGAGGSARAVIYALGRLGWQVFICARRSGQAARLIADLDRGSIRPPTYLPWDALESYKNTGLVRFDLLVNTTPLGMAPDESSSPWPEGVSFPPSAFVYDLVYNPTETTLLRKARAAGLQVANGLGMLVEQAALAFERWTGLSAPRKVMRDAVFQISSGGAF